MSFNDVQIIRTPSGEEMVVLSREEFDRLVSLASSQDHYGHEEEAADIAHHEHWMAEYRAGRVEALTSDEAREYLTAPTPLAFWRKHRGLTQQDLADRAGIPQAYVSQIEAGKRKGSAAKLKALAKVLAVQIDDLVP